MLPIMWIARQQNFLIGLPITELECACADWMLEEVLPVMLDRFMRDDVAEACGKVLEKRREWLCETNDEGRIVLRDKATHGIGFTVEVIVSTRNNILKDPIATRERLRATDAFERILCIACNELAAL